jgi:hypothetical protein
MPKTHFTKVHRNTASTRYWTWRDMNEQLQSTREEDVQVQEDFSSQAQRVREQVEFLIGGGSGTEEALATLAEQDMINFCVLVDLAEGVVIAGVEPLPSTSRERLNRFIHEEPWRSLAVDNEISVALALLDSVGAPEPGASIKRLPAGLLDVVESVFENVDSEQFGRFTQEYRLLRDRDQIFLPKQVAGVFGECMHRSALRLGLKSPNDLP